METNTNQNITEGEKNPTPTQPANTNGQSSRAVPRKRSTKKNTTIAKGGEVAMSFPYGKQDLLKIIRGLAIAIAGAGLTYTLQVISHTNFGANTAIIMAIASMLVTATIKALDGIKE